MLMYTVKNLLKNFSTFSKGNSYELEFIGNKSKNKYTFLIKDSISVQIKDENDNELLWTQIDNIDALALTDTKLKPVKLLETKWKNNGEVFEKCEKMISYPAQMYITLFNLMYKKVSFVFRYNNETIHAIYLEGKTMFVEQTDTEYILKGTDLNQLHHHYPNYEILHVSPCLIKFSYRIFMEEQEQVASKLGKKFVKIRLGERVA